jgi:hypothetical protein
LKKKIVENVEKSSLLLNIISMRNEKKRRKMEIRRKN